MLQIGDTAYLFKGFEDGPSSMAAGKGRRKAALLEKWEDHQVIEVLKLHEGESFGLPPAPGSLTVRNFRSVDVTGLLAKVDRGFPPVLIGMIVAGIGLSITYIRKMKDNAS